MIKLVQFFKSNTPFFNFFFQIIHYSPMDFITTMFRIEILCGNNTNIIDLVNVQLKVQKNQICKNITINPRIFHRAPQYVYFSTYKYLWIGLGQEMPDLSTDKYFKICARLSRLLSLFVCVQKQSNGVPIHETPWINTNWRCNKYNTLIGVTKNTVNFMLTKKRKTVGNKSKILSSPTDSRFAGVIFANNYTRVFHTILNLFLLNEIEMGQTSGPKWSSSFHNSNNQLYKKNTC